MPVPPPFRLARATAFAAVCVILTSLGHFVASGRSVPPGTILFGFVLVLAFALVLSGRERSLATILGRAAVRSVRAARAVRRRARAAPFRPTA